MESYKFNISKKFIVTFLIIILNQINIFSSIILTLNAKETSCIYKELKTYTSYRFQYFFSGKEEEKNIVTVESQSTDSDSTLVLFKSENKKENSWIIDHSNQIREIYICFKSLSIHTLSVSFDIFKDKSLRNIITIDSIDRLNFSIEDLKGKLANLQSGFVNSIVRKVFHYDIINLIMRRIMLFAYLKIVLFFLFFCFQIWFLSNKVKNWKCVLGSCSKREIKKISFGDSGQVL